MDSNNPNRPGAKFDPVTGEPISGRLETDNLEASNPPEPTPPTPAAPTAGATGQEFRVATGGTDAEQPSPTEPQVTPTAYSYTVSPPLAEPITPTAPQPVLQARPYTEPQPVYAPPPPPQQVNVNQKKSSNTPLILGALAVLLIAGAVGTYFLLNRAGIVGGNDAAIERALPANTLGYFQFDPNPSESQKQAFDRMREAFESQPGFKEAVEGLTENMSGTLGDEECFPAPEGQGFEGINSYLGDSVTLAVLAPSADDLNTIKAAAQEGEPGEIGTVVGRNVVGLVDLDFSPLNKRGPLAQIKTIADNKTELVENYNGTDIRKYSCKDVTLYFGTLEGSNTAVVGSETAGIKRIVDEYKLNKGLKDDNTFKFLSGKVPGDRVAAFYLNMSEMFRYAEVMAPEMFSSGQVPSVKGAMLMTLSGQDDGIQFDMATETTVENLGYNFTSSAAKPDASTLSDVPQDALGFIASADLKSTITAALDALENQSPDMFGDIEAQVKEATSLDLRNDILSWMGGDYVISVSTPEDKSDVANVPVVFQLKVSGDDRAKAADSLRKAITHSMGAEAQSFEAAGGTFYKFENAAAIGVGADRLMLVVLPGNRGDIEAAVARYAGEFGKGLGTTDKWKDASRHLPADSNMIFYLDGAAVRQMAEESLDETAKEAYEDSTAPFVRPFNYVLMGSSSDPFKENEPVRSLFRLFVGITK